MDSRFQNLSDDGLFALAERRMDEVVLIVNAHMISLPSGRRVAMIAALTEANAALKEIKTRLEMPVA